MAVVTVKEAQAQHQNIYVYAYVDDPQRGRYYDEAHVIIGVCLNGVKYPVIEEMRSFFDGDEATVSIEELQGLKEDPEFYQAFLNKIA